MEIPTPPNDQVDEQPTHIYVVIGMYFMLKDGHYGPNRIIEYSDTLSNSHTMRENL